MMNLIKKLIGDKKEYKEMMKRVDELPKDYQTVYHNICNYMWGFASGSGMDMLRIQYELIDLFEAGVAEGKDVLEITGADVTAFADELTEQGKRWDDKYRTKLNDSIHKYFGK